MRKHLPVAALAALFLAGAVVLAVPSLLIADDTPSGNVTSVFKVEGMTCGGCEAGVRISVEKLDGVEEVEASHKEARATVTYDASKVSPEQIVEAIKKLGYKAELQEPEEGTEEPTSSTFSLADLFSCC